MIMPMDKRGVSAVVATVLIILILTGAIAIVWVSILGIASSVEFEDVEPNVEIVISKGYTVCDGRVSGNETLLVQLRRGDDTYHIDDVSLLVKLGGDTVRWVVPAPEPNSLITHAINVSGYPACFDKAAVAPIFTGPNGKRTEGSITSEVDVPDKPIIDLPETDDLLDPDEIGGVTPPTNPGAGSGSDPPF